MFIVKNFSHFEARGKVYLPMSLPRNSLNADAPIFTLVEPTGPPSDEVAGSAAASTPSDEVAASAAPIASSQRVSAAHNTSNIDYNPYFLENVYYSSRWWFFGIIWKSSHYRKIELYKTI